MTRRQAVGAWACNFKNYPWASGFASPYPSADPFIAEGRILPPNTYVYEYDYETGESRVLGRLT